MRLTSVYTLCCSRCGANVVTTAAEGVCVCGSPYRIDWQAPYAPPPQPPPPSLENGAA
jgi:hypothetical protein